MSIRTALMRSLYNEDLPEYTTLLETISSIDQVQNTKGTNTLHDLANSSHTIMPYYLKLINTLPLSLVQQMLSSKSSEKDDQTPLQLSITFNKKWRALAFISICKDLSIKDDRGRSLLHLSVRSNNILILTKLLEKGLDINEADCSGNTCLHLAILERYTDMALAIIELDANINIQGEGLNTPLHLAVSLDDYRVVRRLIVKEADKSIINDEGNKIVDIEMTNDIRQLFSSKVLCEKHQFIKNPVYAWVLVIAFILKFIFLWLVDLEKMEFSQILLVYPDFVYFILVFLVFAGNISFFLLSSFIDPGYTTKTQAKYSTLLTKHRPESVCIPCRGLKTRETYHCIICNRCVQNYDHHCKWINNCVGQKNITFFTAFLIFSLADLFIGFLAGPKMLIKNSSYLTSSSITQLLSIILCGFMIVIIAPIAFLQVTNRINSTTTSDRFSKKSKSSLNTSIFRDSFMDTVFED